MSAALNKDPLILVTLDQLWSRLGSDAFEVVDHWEGDLTAVGIASPRNHGVLIYLASYPDGFHVELELPSPPGAPFPYQVAGRHTGLEFDRLVGIVAEHLDRA
jgi:hypothetical protein